VRHSVAPDGREESEEDHVPVEDRVHRELKCNVTFTNKTPMPGANPTILSYNAL
jgi:hypothetical protein